MWAEATGRSDLIDRDQERQQLRTLLGEAVDGSPRFVALVGEPGIGKSRLVGALAATLETRRTTLLHSRASRDGSAPLVLMNQLADQLRDDGHRIDDTGELPARIIDLAERRPVVVLAEDLHWMDQASLRELEDLAIRSGGPVRRGDPCKLLVVATSRPYEPTEPVGLLFERILRPGPHGNRIELGPLDEVASNQLLRVLLRPEWSRRWRDEVFQATGGVPLLIEAAARQIDASHGEYFERRALRDVRTAVDQQLEQLSDSQRRLLAVAAIVGEPIDADAVGAVAEASDQEVAAALDAAWGCGLVHGGGAAPFRLAHPLVAERAFDTIPPTERGALHARAAAWLRDRGADAVTVTHHLMRAGSAADAEAIAAVAPEAARMAFDRAAWRSAADFAEKSLVVGPADSEDRGHLGLLAGVARFRNYDLEESEALLTAAEAVAEEAGDRELATEVRVAQIRAYLTFSTQYEPPSLPVGVLDDDVITADARSRLAESLAELHCFSDIELAEHYADQSLVLAREAERPGTVGRAHFAKGLVEMETLRLEAALEEFRASATFLEADEDRWRGLWGLGRVPLVALLLGRLDLAESSARRAVHAADEVRAFGEGGLARAVWSAVALTHGRLDAARDLAREALGRTGRSDFVWPPRIALPVIATSHALEGDAGQAHAALDELELLGTRMGRARRRWVDWAAAGGVLEEPFRLQRPPPRLTAWSAGQLFTIADLIAQTDDREAGVSVLDALTTDRDDGLVFPAEGLTSRGRCVGELLASLGRTEEARTALLRSAHQADHARALPEAGRAHLALADVMRDQGADSETVTVHLETAGERFAAAGMTPWVDRVDGQLRARGAGARAGAQTAIDGECALLMTDVVGSTPLAVELGDDEWIWILGRHDHLLRGAIQDHGGTEFAHTGDGIAAWFFTAAEAYAAARDVQGRLAVFNQNRRPPIHVRIGLVWGAPALRHGLPGGLLAARVNRVMSCAGARQVAADDLFMTELDGSGTGWEDQGELDLKGFEGRHRIWRLHVPE